MKDITRLLGNLLIVVALLAYFPSITAQSVNVVEQSLTLNIFQGQEITQDITVENKGASPIQLSFTHNLDLMDNDNDIITISFSDPGTIQPGATANVTLTLDADPTIDLETYSGTVTVKDTNTSDQDTFALKVTVQPDVCDVGQTGNDLVLDIEKPDSGDDFTPGDTLTIRANVKNVGDDNIDIRLEAFLFNEDRDVASAASDAVNIEEDDDKDFTFILDVPLDPKDINKDDKFTLVVKAFDDDNENINCIQQQVALNVDLPTKSAKIDKDATSVTPSQAICGESVFFTTRVVNLGKKDISQASITVKSTELNLKQQTPPFKLNSFEDKDDFEITRTIELRLPKGIKPKVYPFEILFAFDGNSQIMTLPVQVFECKAEEKEHFPGPGIVFSGPTVSLASSRIEALPSSTDTFQATITNAQSAPMTFTLIIQGLEDILDSSETKTLMIAPGKSSTAFVGFSVSSDAQPGVHSGTLRVLVDNQPLASAPVSIVIPKPEEPQVSFLENIPLPFWMIVNLLILLVIIFSFKVLIARK